MGRRGSLANLAAGAVLSSCVLAWPGSGLDASNSGRSVRRVAMSCGVRASIDWTDFGGHRRTVDVILADSALAETERSFGFTCDELRKFLKRTEAEIRQDMGLSAPDIARKVVDARSGGDWCRVAEDPANDFQFVLRTEGADDAARAAEVEGIIKASSQAWEASRKKIKSRLLRETEVFLGSRGMVMTPHGIAVDYRKIIRESRATLAPLTAEFRRACGRDQKKVLEAVLSFVQAIPYRPRDASESGKYTAGLALPLRVLADDSGDCDSKAVLFAAIWTSLCRHRTVLITVREHMLVGVAVPLAFGATLDLDGIRYALLEVNCGGSFPPGEVTAHSLASIDRGELKYKIVS